MMEREWHKLEGVWMTREVWLDGHKLMPWKSLKLVNHSPDGFNWGYSGSGPAQLALAILLVFLSDELALAQYQSFKEKLIAGLPHHDFKLEFSLLPNLEYRMVREKGISEEQDKEDVGLSAKVMGRIWDRK